MHNRQSGITVIETLGALAIGTMMLLGLTAMTDASMDDLKGQQAALHQSQVVEAARKYMTANYVSLIGSATAGPALAVTVDELKTANFLPDSFSATNAYGQTACVLILESVAGRLDALVVTRGGEKIPDRFIPAVAMEAGKGSGYISDADFATARGASWALDTTAYRGVTCGTAEVVLDGTQARDGGRLASNIFYDGQLRADFLYRNAYPDRPELNQMNTPIRMGAAAAVASNTDCTVNGVAQAALAVDSTTRTLLTCGANGLWTAGSFWKDPVDSHGDLPTTGNAPGDVRMLKNESVAHNRSIAYSWNGTTWVALAVDKDGDLGVPRDITAGRNISGVDMVASGDVYARDVNAQRDVLAGNNVDAEGGIFGLYMYSGHYQIQEIFGPGSLCNYPSPDGPWIEFPTGSVVQDWNGISMSCQFVGGIYTFRYANGLLTP